ncbi:DUF2767 family protein [Superficieibacter sp. BNK-5]|uniref:DUF2767 family protein n=1 Tax=Superficieibacter sp. BNK-5 TaxID=3376142 RepID=UPI0039BF66F9
MSNKFDAFNPEEHYAVLCTILGDAVFNLHRENKPVTIAQIVSRLSEERRQRDDKLEDGYYEAVIRVLCEKTN